MLLQSNGLPHWLGTNLKSALHYIAPQSTGGNRTMVAAATIVSMAAADGEHISMFPLVCPNKAPCVSFFAPDI